MAKKRKTMTQNERIARSIAHREKMKKSKMKDTGEINRKFRERYDREMAKANQPTRVEVVPAKREPPNKTEMARFIQGLSDDVVKRSDAPTSGLALFLLGKLQARKRITLISLLEDLPNVASFVRAVFDEKKRRKK